MCRGKVDVSYPSSLTGLKTSHKIHKDGLASSQLLSLLWVLEIDLESPVVESGVNNLCQGRFFVPKKKVVKMLPLFVGPRSFLPISRVEPLGVARLWVSVGVGGLLWCLCQNEGGSDLSSPKTSSSGRCFRWRIVCDLRLDRTKMLQAWKSSCNSRGPERWQAAWFRKSTFFELQ